MGWRVVAVKIRVYGVFELIALLVFGLDAVFVEGTLEKHGRGGDASHLKRGVRLHPQIAGGGAQHIGGDDHGIRIKALAMGDYRLVGAAHIDDGVADFLGGRRRNAAFGQADKDALDPRIIGGVMQGGDHVHGRKALAGEESEGRIAALVGHFLAQVERQDDGGRHFRLRGRSDHYDRADRQRNKDNQQGHDCGCQRNKELFHM